jgi:hypothetical protein
MNKKVVISYFKCNSMVSGFGNLPDFPEIDAFSYIRLGDIDILHETQIRFILDIIKNYNFFSGESALPSIKSHLYG